LGHETTLFMGRIAKAKEINAYLRLTESAICRRPASEGHLPGFKMGKSWRFDMDEIIRRIYDAKTNRQLRRDNRDSEIRKGECL
jgi:hypothetical protein